MLRTAAQRQSETTVSFETNVVERSVTIRCPHRLLGLARDLRDVIAELDTEIQRVLGVKVSSEPCEIYLAEFREGTPAPGRGLLSGLTSGGVRLTLPVLNRGEPWNGRGNHALADGVMSGLVYAWTRRSLAAEISGEERRWVLEGISRYVVWRVAHQFDRGAVRRMEAYWLPTVSLDRPAVRQSLLWWDGPVVAPVRLSDVEQLENGATGSERARARQGAALRLIQRLVEISGPDSVLSMIRGIRKWVKPGDPPRLYRQLTRRSLHDVGQLDPKADIALLIKGVDLISRDGAAGKRWGLGIMEHLGRKYQVASMPTYPVKSDLPRYLALGGTEAARAVKEDDLGVRIAAARALAVLGREEVDVFLERDLDRLLRVAPESGLRILGDLGLAKKRPKGRAVLFSLLVDQRESVRREAAGALRRCTGRSFGYDARAAGALRKEAIERWRGYLDTLERQQD